MKLQNYMTILFMQIDGKMWKQVNYAKIEFRFVRQALTISLKREKHSTETIIGFHFTLLLRLIYLI